MAILRVVLDTNVVLSALLFRQGRLSSLRQAWQDRRFVPVACGQTMEELTRILGYQKFRLDASDIGSALALYVPYVEVHTLKDPAQTKDQVPLCRDPKDQVFLDLAQSAQVDFLVSVDADLLVLDESLPSRNSFRIVTPQDFMRVVPL